MTTYRCRLFGSPKTKKVEADHQADAAWEFLEDREPGALIVVELWKGTPGKHLLDWWAYRGDGSLSLPSKDHLTTTKIYG